MSASRRLVELGITLPELTAPVGSYVPATRVGDLIMTSGQLPMIQGELTAVGKVPEEVSLADAQKAARAAAINALAAVASMVGGVDHIERIVRLAVFVNCNPEFTDQAKVANGASDFLVDLFGEQGKHVRVAVGAAALPLNAAVELELTAQIKAH